VLQRSDFTKLMLVSLMLTVSSGRLALAADEDATKQKGKVAGILVGFDLKATKWFTASLIFGRRARAETLVSRMRVT
jgi:hypothetical protein